GLVLCFISLLHFLCFLLFLLLLLPPSSTLFPYTTLFRSFLINLFAGISSPWFFWPMLPLTIPLVILAWRAFALIRFDEDWVERQDRKSTRLNSSHVKISYAVFCLKKKNKSYTIHACGSCC